MARGGLTPEDRRLWGRVAATVSPRRAGGAASGDPDPVPPSSAAPVLAPPRKSVRKIEPSAGPVALPPQKPAPQNAITPRARPAPETLEPRRQRRLSRERDPIEAKIDLHGFSRFQAEDALAAFLLRCQGRGLRSVLVVTGQGRRGGGVIRASIHDWLRAPALRGVVSGFAPAGRRHGGEGAIYVTLRPHG